MSDNSAIEWTDASWNPITGCTKVSPGCDHCYAETFAERFRGTPGHHFENGFDVTLRPDKLDLPLRWRKPRRIFVNSMSDLFHKDIPDDYIASVFAVMARAERHTFQLLTKRHARMRCLLSSSEFNEAVTAHLPSPAAVYLPWPLPNVWLGVSVEDQHWADIRIPALLDTPAAVRWISAEPLLGPVDLIGVVGQGCEGAGPAITHSGYSTRTDYGAGVEYDCDHEVGLDWVVAGGESGRGARPMHPDWARSLRDQCQQAGVPFLLKQWGEWGPAPWRVDREDGETDAAYKARAEASCATHAYARWAHRYGHEPYRPGYKPWSCERSRLPAEQAPIRRWGKRAAGRELDGRTWDEYPSVGRSA